MIEISDSSLRFDRITKARFYARYGAEEYWIVNVQDAVVEVHREPSGEQWALHTVRGGGEVLEPAGLPGVAIAVDPLLAVLAGRDPAAW